MAEGRKTMRTSQIPVAASSNDKFRTHLADSKTKKYTQKLQLATAADLGSQLQTSDAARNAPHLPLKLAIIVWMQMLSDRLCRFFNCMEQMEG